MVVSKEAVMTQCENRLNVFVIRPHEIVGANDEKLHFQNDGL